MATEFGDIEPEDSWHPDDPVPIQVFNLLRRIDLLDRRREGSLGNLVITLIGATVTEYQERIHDMEPRDQIRVEQLIEDYLHVKARHG